MSKRSLNLIALTPLDHCPICCYPLQGLPQAHRCPECNFQYDEHTRLWEKKSQPKKRMLPIWIIIGVLFLVFAQPVYMTVGSSRQMQFGVCVLLLANILPLAIIHYRQYFCRRFVVLHPDGLTLKSELGRLKSYSWDELEKLNWTIMGGPPIEIQSYFPERPVYERLIAVVGRWSETRPEVCEAIADEIRRRSAVEPRP